MSANTMFHVTEINNLTSILAEGLVPRIGERSAELGEITPAVYLFSTLDDLLNAMGSWLGECFDEDIELTAFEVNTSGLELTPTFDEEDGTSWENICFDTIPATALSVRDDLNL